MPVITDEWAISQRRVGHHLITLVFVQCCLGCVWCQGHVINVVVPGQAPFACTEAAPCSPFVPIPMSSDGCLHGGVRAANVQDKFGRDACIHGFMIDLLEVTASKTGFRYNLWYWPNNATLGGYNNMVKNVFYAGEQPGAGKSKGDGSYIMVPNLCGNETCHMAVGDITLNWARQRIPASRWSPHFMTVGLRIIARVYRPPRDYEETFTSAFQSPLGDPFDAALWMTIPCTMIFLSWVLAMLENPVYRSSLCSFCLPWKACETRPTPYSSRASPVMAAPQYLGSAGHDTEAHTSPSSEEENSDFKKSWAYQAVSMNMPFGEWFWFSMQSIFLSQDNALIRTKTSRLIWWWWMLICLLLVACYTASLTAMLQDTTLQFLLPGLSPDDHAASSLRNAVMGAGKFGMPTTVARKGGNTEQYLTNILHINASDIRDERGINGSGIQRASYIMNDPNVLVWVSDETSIQYAIGALFFSQGSGNRRKSGRGKRRKGSGAGQSVAAKTGDANDPDYDPELNARQEKMCEWNIVGPAFAEQAFAMAYGPTMPRSVRESLDEVLGSLKSDLSLKSLKENWFLDYPSCFVVPEPPLLSYSLNQFWIVFLVLWVSCIVAVLYRTVQDQIALANAPEPIGFSEWFLKMSQSKFVKLLFMVQGMEEQSLDSRDVSSYGLLKELYELSVDMKLDLQHQGKLHLETVQNLVDDFKNSTGDGDQKLEPGLPSRVNSPSRHQNDPHVLPPGWIRKYDRSIGQVYYLNLETCRRQWQRPTLVKASAQSSLRQAAAKVILANHFVASFKKQGIGSSRVPERDSQKDFRDEETSSAAPREIVDSLSLSLKRHSPLRIDVGRDSPSAATPEIVDPPHLISVIDTDTYPLPEPSFLPSYGKGEASSSRAMTPEGGTSRASTPRARNKTLPDEQEVNGEAQGPREK